MKIRAFTPEDAAELRQRMPELSASEAETMIRDWNTGEYGGKTFLIYAVTVSGAVAGSVSVYRIAEDTASLGIEIYPEFRRNGYAETAMRFAERQAAALGCTKLRDEVRSDNIASIALHRKLGFIKDENGYLNRKGHAVCAWRKEIKEND